MNSPKDFKRESVINVGIFKNISTIMILDRVLCLFWDKDLGKSTPNMSIHTISGNLETILNAHWISLCCFLERLVQEYSNLASNFNKIFEEEMFAYRFIDGKLTPVTDDTEIKEIEDALDSSKDGISHHLKQAISQLAKKPTPDYRNCIKESISAVEAACREITGENELGQALAKLSKKHNLNNEFKNGLQKFYNFTNDKSTGIRHALMNTDANIEIGYADAKYMLVVCSAFINYLRDKYNN